MLIFHHDDCENHNIRDHPEQPARVSSILAKLQQQWPIDCFKLAPMCTDEHILLFHTQGHLDELKTHFRKSESSIGKNSIEVIDGDTKIMKKTRVAVYRAVGSVVAAVDSILSANNNNEFPTTRSAFCCVRPPGHHAEPSRAGGFCFFNNAAIGARYAQKAYGINKVAVIDFDVHHGNGTEAGFRNDPTLFYGSTHEANIFPGTGIEPPLIGENATNEQDRRIVNRYLHPGPNSVQEFRYKWREILAEMERFQPGLVIISAGFDAHDEDPLASCELQEEDFEWATIEVVASCHRINPSQPVPCFSVLEGGYDLEAISTSAAVHVQALANSHKNFIPTMTLEKETKKEGIVTPPPPPTLKDNQDQLSPIPIPIDFLDDKDNLIISEFTENLPIVPSPLPILSSTTGAIISTGDQTTSTITLNDLSESNTSYDQIFYDKLVEEFTKIKSQREADTTTIRSTTVTSCVQGHNNDKVVDEVVELMRNTTLDSVDVNAV